MQDIIHSSYNASERVNPLAHHVTASTAVAAPLSLTTRATATAARAEEPYAQRT